MGHRKYNSAKHKALRVIYGARIQAGNGWCTEPVCLMPSRAIPPDTPSTEWHVPHNEDGVTYRDGPAHARCNTADGGRRNRRPRTRLWIL